MYTVPNNDVKFFNTICEEKIINIYREILDLQRKL